MFTRKDKGASFLKEGKEQKALFDETVKRKRKLKNSPPSTRKRGMVKPSVAEVLSIRELTANGSFELQGNKGYLDIMQIQSKDIYSPSTQETEYDIMMMAKFFQSYAQDIKIVSMNFPVDMQKQLDAINYKITQNKAPLFEKFLLKKRDELQFLETHRTNREFYLYIYAASLKQLAEYRQNCQRYLGRVAPLIELPEEKKLDLVHKLHNQNTKLEKRG